MTCEEKRKLAEYGVAPSVVWACHNSWPFQGECITLEDGTDAFLFLGGRLILTVDDYWSVVGVGSV